MFRHLFAVILLISHVDVSMFIAQVDEVDIFDKNGRPVNDINTLSEYIHDVLLHKQNKPRQDEDDDNARYFQVSATPLYDFHQYKVKVSADNLCPVKKEYSLFKEDKWFPPVMEILVPPPKMK